MRDGHSRVIFGSTPNESLNKTTKDDESRSRKAVPVIKKLTERFSSNKSRSSSETTVDRRSRTTVVGQHWRHTTDCDITENNAFNMIGDDDL